MTSYVAHEIFGGIYCKDSRQYVNKRLDRMPSAQAGIIFDDRGTHLISYTTLVCTIDKEGFLSCTGTYSATTRKHIGAFLKECAPNMCYYDAKSCYENNHMINIHTGEIVALA